MYIVVKSYFQKAASEVHDFFLIHAVSIYLYIYISYYRFVNHWFNFMKKIESTDKMREKYFRTYS